MDSDKAPPFYESVAITIIVLNVISLLSLVFVLVIYICNWKKIASFPMRLSFYLCVACLGQNLYVILFNPLTIHGIEDQNEYTSGYCVFEGILKVGFDLSSILWTTLIIYSVYASVVLKINLESKQMFYIVIAYVVPFVAAGIPAFFDKYGFVSYFCWFVSQDPNTAFWLKMGFFYIPLWIFFVINLTLSVITYYKLKRIELEPRLLTIFKRLMLFPFIMFITGFFATADLIETEVTNSSVIWLNTIGLVFLSLYGFFNSVAYGFNPLIREKIEKVFSSSSQRGSTNESRLQDDTSSRNTEKLQAELFEYRSSRGISQPIVAKE